MGNVGVGKALKRGRTGKSIVCQVFADPLAFTLWCGKVNCAAKVLVKDRGNSQACGDQVGNRNVGIRQVYH